MAKPMTERMARSLATWIVTDLAERQWQLMHVAQYLPRGWHLNDSADKADFLPLTIPTVTDTLTRLAERA